jgi:hypothetical protein
MVSSSASRVQVNDLLSRVVVWFHENRIFAPCSRQAYLMLAQIHCDLSPMANPIGDIVAAT